jgi:hypothetical protein
MNKYFLMAFSCLAATAFAQTGRVLIGVQNADLKIRDTTIDHVLTTVILDSEKIVLHNLGITFIFGATDGHGNPDESTTRVDTCVLHWANDSGGYPQIMMMQPRAPLPRPNFDYACLPGTYNPMSADSFAYQWGTTRDTIWELLSLWGEARHRPEHFGLLDSTDAHFRDSVRMLIHQYKQDYDRDTGFSVLFLGYEEHEWKWVDTAHRVYDGDTVSRIKDHAEQVAERWRKGMNFIAREMKDSALRAKSFYLEETAYVPGYGGNSLYNIAKERTVKATIPDSLAYGDIYHDGMDGVPDTLAKLAQYFSDMALVDYHGVQRYPCIYRQQQNSVEDQKALSVNSHNWHATANGIARVRKDRRAYHHANPARTDTLPIPTTELFAMIQSHQQDSSVPGYTGTTRQPTRTETEVLVNIGFCCGVKIPCYYYYDVFSSIDLAGDTTIHRHETGIRDWHLNNPSAPTKHNIVQSVYDSIKWVNDSVMRSFAPIMDTLEY